MKNRLFGSIFFCFPVFLFAQSHIGWTTLAPMPERVTNNAVTAATVDGLMHVYSFAGIDSTKSCDGDHLRSFKFDYENNEWESIAPLPDPMGGKIAAGASTVKNKIYIIGGYHLSANCGEISSSKVHIYDPELDVYLPDGADLPKAIDDHVQAVWRDSLIYVITGWSNSNNVFDVQIYNPTADEWEAGTPIPSQAGWRSFGASGTIVGDTIYFAGGAGNWNGSSFPPLNYLRKGYINPDDPTDIDWLPAQQMDEANGYRMGASAFGTRPVWFGGSDETYNFDGIAYDGSGAVPALGRITFYLPETGGMTQVYDSIPPIMDLRGVAKVDLNEFVLAGGMEENQEVSNRVIAVTIDVFTATTEPILEKSIEVYPNPASEAIQIKGVNESFQLRIYDSQGKNVLNGTYGKEEIIVIQHLPAGVYYLNMIKEAGRVSNQKLLIK